MTNEELFKLREYDTLYTKNLPFMHSIIKRFRNLSIETEDLMGCGNIAFMKCLEKYDPEASKWLTYFSKVMINEILMLNRRVSKQMRCVSLETIVIADDNNKEITLEHLISTGPLLEDYVVDKVTVGEVLALTVKLPAREREALRLHLLGKKQAYIGERLNLSQAYVSRLIKKVSNELYRAYMQGA